MFSEVRSSLRSLLAAQGALWETLYSKLSLNRQEQTVVKRFLGPLHSAATATIATAATTAASAANAFMTTIATAATAAAMAIVATVTLTIFSPSAAFAGNSLSEIAQRCPAQPSAEPVLRQNDFSWGYSLPDMLVKLIETYSSKKRLAARAYWNTDKQALMLPFIPAWGGEFEVTEIFVRAVARHVEQALALGYADAVFFPDMGHSHLLIPEELMAEKYSRFDAPEFAKMYQEMLRDPQVKIFYHTAEQLQLVDADRVPLKDEKIAWRRHTRNIAGPISPKAELELFQNEESPTNTVSEVAGYRWWGAGFNLSASENGCFEYRSPQGQVFRFDISMKDLEPDPDGSYGDDY